MATDSENCSSRSSCSQAGADGSGCASCSVKDPNDPFVLQNKEISKTLSHIKHVIFVMSGKGGVGKSSVSVNIATALAEHGYKVGVLDVDLHGPSVANLFGTDSGLEIDETTHKLLPVEYRENLHLLSMDSLLQNKNTAVLWRGPKKTSAIRQFISEVQWGDLDFLVIDSPPGTGDEHMTLLKAIPNIECVVVTTPQELSLADVRKAMNFLQFSQSRILGVVENMSGLACPHCGGEIELFKKGGGEKLAKQYKVPFLGAIPLDPMTVVAADRGEPIVALKEDTPAKEAFLKLAKTIAENANNKKYVVLDPPKEEN